MLDRARLRRALERRLLPLRAAGCRGGDGCVDVAGDEECDDGGNVPGDGCSPTSASSQAPGPEPSRPPDWLGQGCTLRSPNGSEGSVNGSTTHNYSFTSELRFWFQYQGGEQIVFEGDDDVWGFINRQLVIDLGGLHDEYGGDVCGNVWSALESRPSCSGLGNATTNVEGAPLNLQSGRLYEVAIFQAETPHLSLQLRFASRKLPPRSQRVRGELRRRSGRRRRSL